MPTTQYSIFVSPHYKSFLIKTNRNSAHRVALPSKVYTHQIGQAILDSNIMLKPNLIKTKYILTFSLFLCFEFSGAFPISGGQDDFFTLSPHLLQGIDVSQVQDIGKLYIANIR